MFWAMAGRQAKILTSTELEFLLRLALQTRQPLRNRVIVLLSAKAGFRAGEIAALTWDMVIDAQGRIGNVVELRDSIAKMGSGRRIPIHRDLHAALTELRAERRGSGYVVES